jgi:hypothetical protein
MTAGCPLKDFTALLGNCRLLRRPVENLDIELGFQLFDPFRNRRLRRIEFIGRLGEPAKLDHPIESFDLFERQHGITCAINPCLFCRPPAQGYISGGENDVSLADGILALESTASTNALLSKATAPSIKDSIGLCR